MKEDYTDRNFGRFGTDVKYVQSYGLLPIKNNWGDALA
jgi:hypothetical protein